jgi:hypothetical protein
LVIITPLKKRTINGDPVTTLKIGSVQVLRFSHARTGHNESF